MGSVEGRLNSKDWAQKIRMLRREKGWSQKNLADKLELHSQSISEIERGCEKLTLERLARLLDALDYTGRVEARECMSKTRADWGKIRKKDPEKRRLVKNARELAEQMADLLYLDFAVDKVYCIGSLGSDFGQRFENKSDIDLVVAGLKASEQISARSALELKVIESLPEHRRHPFDLIRREDYDNNPESLRKENKAVFISPPAIETDE